MLFLANENFPLPSIRLLRQAGYDVAAIMEDSAGASDTVVLARAASEQRIILTFDRDYGELLYRLRLPPPPGLAYFRLDPLSPIEPAEILLRLLAAPNVALEGKFTVIERPTIRQRPLP